MPRVMYDATHANIRAIPLNAEIVAGYLTGSPDIQWTTSDWALFPNAEHVTIDQGGTGSPKVNANVIDVEPYAYSVNQITSWMLHASAPRPTAYLNQNEYAVAKVFYDGPVWLAVPGWTEAECLAHHAGNPQVVAYQNVFAGTYDTSLVVDDYWPLEAPVTHPVTPPPAPHPVPAPVKQPVKCVVTWNGDAGLTSRRTEIPFSMWETLKWESAT